ncbi:hypothetical protein Sango_1539200 [Sesamum angolense]|uniref:Endonuclease/exonuclease/phosphatase domain-containing protein n=1 Tax=Sesamum angolense TaxID=2727404 RepID=A0AAE2BTB9_9LAMI|nr:hypothetical protein Sango_1539200 [Sesamum angolense]
MAQITFSSTPKFWASSHRCYCVPGIRVRGLEVHGFLWIRRCGVSSALLGLSTLKNQSRRAWLIAGDFNEILDDSEKRGGRPRPLWQVRRFREALVSIDVYDLGFEGDPFTWCNRHPEPDIIFERLDRACADSEWRHKFPNTVVRHIPTTSSDHVVLSIDTENNHKPARPKHRPFRFEASWTSSADCEQVIREGWNAWAGNGLVSLAERQRGCAARLQSWYNSKGSHSFKRQIRLREKNLERIRLQPISASTLEESNRVQGILTIG